MSFVLPSRVCIVPGLLVNMVQFLIYRVLPPIFISSQFIWSNSLRLLKSCFISKGFCYSLHFIILQLYLVIYFDNCIFFKVSISTYPQLKEHGLTPCGYLETLMNWTVTLVQTYSSALSHWCGQDTFQGQQYTE